MRGGGRKRQAVDGAVNSGINKGREETLAGRQTKRELAYTLC